MWYDGWPGESKKGSPVCPEPPLGGEQTMDDMHHIQLKLNHVSNELQGLSCKNIGIMIPSIRGQYMAMFPGAARWVNRLQTIVVGLQSLIVLLT
jgi:hypothetical protein